jgi:hypothetical protein
LRGHAKKHPRKMPWPAEKSLAPLRRARQQLAAQTM